MFIAIKEIVNSRIDAYRTDRSYIKANIKVSLCFRFGCVLLLIYFRYHQEHILSRFLFIQTNKI